MTCDLLFSPPLSLVFWLPEPSERLCTAPGAGLSFPRAQFPSRSVPRPVPLAPCCPQTLFRPHGVLKGAHPKPWYMTSGFVTWSILPSSLGHSGLTSPYLPQVCADPQPRWTLSLASATSEASCLCWVQGDRENSLLRATRKHMPPTFQGVRLFCPSQFSYCLGSQRALKSC